MGFLVSRVMSKATLLRPEGMWCCQETQAKRVERETGYLEYTRGNGTEGFLGTRSRLHRVETVRWHPFLGMPLWWLIGVPVTDRIPPSSCLSPAEVVRLGRCLLLLHQLCQLPEL